MSHIAARPRSQALTPFIASFHYHNVGLETTVERILPNGQAHLMINLAEDEFRTYHGPDFGIINRTCGAVLAGPHRRATAIDTKEQRHLIAVEFKLGGAAAFFRMPLSETCDQVLQLDEVWGLEGALLPDRLCEAATPTGKFRVLEAVLIEHIVRWPDPAIAFFVRFCSSAKCSRRKAGHLPTATVRKRST